MERHTKEDEEYFGKLYHEMYRILYHYASGTFSERSDIEDVLQETFKEILVHLKEVRKSPNPRGYAVNVLKYKIKKLQEKKWKQLSRETVTGEELIQSEREEPEDNEGPIVVWDFCKKTLNAVEYKIILRRYRNKESISEISKELGITEGACKMRIRRSLAKLKEAYEKDTKKNK